MPPPTRTSPEGTLPASRSRSSPSAMPGGNPYKNGAPMRLRLETSTGFRSTKWLDRIEVVNRFDIMSNGRGGFFEDTDSYDRLEIL